MEEEEGYRLLLCSGDEVAQGTKSTTGHTMYWTEKKPLCTQCRSDKIAITGEYNAMIFSYVKVRSVKTIFLFEFCCEDCRSEWKKERVKNEDYVNYVNNYVSILQSQGDKENNIMHLHSPYKFFVAS